jgi:hypothetical protein
MTEQAIEPRGMSEAGRVTGIFWEPRPVFENLAQSPRFWAPLLILTALAVVYMFTFSRVVGWETMFRQQFASNPQMEQMTPEQKQQALQIMTKFVGPGATIGAVVTPAMGMLVIAAVLLGCFNLLGGAGIKFRQAFSITCYSSLPSILATIGALTVMLLKNPEDFSLQNPLPLNLGAFLSPGSTAPWLLRLATSIDAFSIWSMLLLALGFSVAARQQKRKMSYGQALVLVLIPWAVYVVLVVGIAAIRGPSTATLG